MILEFKVNGHELSLVTRHKLIANAKNFYFAHFTLPPEYTGKITAHFMLGQTDVPIELDGNFSCEIPSGINDVIKPPSFYVALEVNDVSSGLHLETTSVEVKVNSSGVPSVLLPLQDGTVNEYQKFHELCERIMSASPNQSPGKSLEFTWDGTRLGIRKAKQNINL
jgi:hypothetical protein